MSPGRLERLAAFTENPRYGNPAGVWRGAELPPPDQMQRTARELGYSETIFLAPSGNNRYHVRYFSPEAEVPFCGHATIAAGVRLGQDEGPGTFHFDTLTGDVAVRVQLRGESLQASLTSVEPGYELAAEKLVAAALDCLGWKKEELDGAIPPARAYAGAWHLVLAVATRERLARLRYDFESLKALMLRNELTTVQLVWRESRDVFHSRNPFPVGGVVEDPATGAAAAALGGYLRNSGIVEVPARLNIRQGEDMGRPSRLTVDVPRAGGIIVSGTAVPIT